MRRFRWPSRRHRRDDSGFTLIEAIIALMIMAISVLFIATNVVASATGTVRSEAREVASEIASRTLQEAESLGLTTVAEGLPCSTVNSSGQCKTLAASDPNNHLNFDTSNGCWYYGSVPTPASGSGTASTGYVVPTTTNSEPVPLNPYISSPTANGTTYTVVLYPMVSLGTDPASGAVTCANNNIANVANLPVTLIVEVSWGTSPVNTLSIQTVVYQPPAPITNLGNCPADGPQPSAHWESGVANPQYDGNSVSYTEDANGLTTTSPVSAGGTNYVSLLSIDEGAPSAPPVLCLLNSNGQTEYECFYPPGNPSACPNGTGIQLTTNQYGTSTSNLYLTPSGDTRIAALPGNPAGTPGAIAAVHPTGIDASGAGSGDNAASPPSTTSSTKYPSMYCTTYPGGNCAFEAQYEFNLPSVTPTGLNYVQATLLVYDHEGDGDFFTWTVSSS